MSDQLPKKPQLSRYGSAHARSKAAAKKGESGIGKSPKAHGYNATNYHQNANKKGIHSLVKFDCPVCQCKNTVLVDLDTKKHMATVRCTYCLSLKPRPAELPYPYTTPYTPHLENKADAFFRFNEAYRALLRQPASGDVCDGSPVAPLSSVSSSSAATAAAVELAGGLLGGLDDVLLSVDAQVTSLMAGSAAMAASKAAVNEKVNETQGSALNEQVEAPTVGEGDDADAVEDVNAFFNDED